MGNINFIDALKNMQDGKCYKIKNSGMSEAVVFSFVDGNFSYYGSGKKWQVASINLNYLVDAEFEEVPDPSNKVGLWEHGNTVDRHYVIRLNKGDEPIIGYLFKQQHEGEAWLEAIITFMDLKNHRMAVKAGNDIYQWCIDFDIESDSIKAIGGQDNNWKGVLLSPFFNDKISAESAINDIGKDRVLHMAKTFQGIYE